MAGALCACHGQPRYAVERLVVAETDASQRLERIGIAPEALRDDALALLAKTPRFVPAGAGGAQRLLGQVIVDRAEAFAAGPGGAAGGAAPQQPAPEARAEAPAEPREAAAPPAERPPERPSGGES